jgi:xylulokinase
VVEATSLGAAIAGGVGIGLYRDFGAASGLVEVEPGEQPLPDRAARYEELYHVFRRTYESLVGVYDEIAALGSASA